MGYMNNTVIKLPIYTNSHTSIGGQIINIIPKEIHVFIHRRRAYKQRHSQIVY